MLNPNTLREFQEAVRSNPELSRFNNYHIGRIQLAERTGSSLTAPDAKEPPWTGRMRKPLALFGAPYEPACLNGIGDLDLFVPSKSIELVRYGRAIGNDAVLSGEHMLFCPGRAGSIDSLDQAARRNAAMHQGFLIEYVDNSYFAYFVMRKSKRHFDYDAVFFHCVEPSNYGSFLFRQLPQMLLLAEKRISSDVVIVPERTPWLREALSLCGLNDRPIYTIREVCGDSFNSILITNDFSSEGAFCESTISRLRRIARRVWCRSQAETHEDCEETHQDVVSLSGTDRRIFVSRELNTVSRPWYRQLVNEIELQDLFSSRGFEIVHPETLSFRDQIRLFSSAKFIAGVSGSGLLNAVFAAESARVLDIEVFHHTVRQHAKIYSTSGKQYGFLFGMPIEPDRFPLHTGPWIVDLRKATDAIDWLIN